MTVHWTGPARQDLLSIGLHVGEDSPQAAERLVARIRSAVNMLEAHPLIGRVSRRRGAREFVITRTPYIALYRVLRRERRTDVEILRVFHGARDWR